MSSNLDEVLQQHRDLQRKMPRSWNPFFAGFGSLREVQLKAMPVVLTGNNVLVTAPTAGGKTQSVVAPICERLVQRNWQGLSVLIITPTRALVNDLYHRLSQPIGDMGIRLGRKTGDHAIAKNPTEQVLITTPESTESLLTFRRESLANINAIILDEIHLLDGSPRGDQLRVVLNRLQAFRSFSGGPHFAGIQRIAMSATVSDPIRLAEVYLGRESSIVTVPGQREIQSQIMLMAGSDKDRAEFAISQTHQFAEVHKVLVFVNSRKQVDSGASDFQHGRFASFPVYGHHGSLSKSEREATEERFKADRCAVCVATMTLEVGIDIGDIDLVICMDPPFSLSSFLQRIGRGCRRLNGLTRVLSVARDRAGELMFDALIQQAARGVPAEPTPPFRRSVLLQQILAYLKQVPKNQRILPQFLNAIESDANPQISEALISSLLADMTGEGLVDHRSGVYQPTSDGWGFIESGRIYGNIQSNPIEIALIDVDTGNAVASVASVSNAANVRIAGKSYDILPGSTGNQLRIRGGAENGDAPRYHARSLPYSFSMGASLANKFGVDPTKLLAMRVSSNVVVMTWLGRLLNRVLAEGLKRQGHQVADGSFHVAIENTGKDVLSAIRQAVADVVQNNPLPKLRPEDWIDLGPHFRLLSQSEQERARADCLDSQFLEVWMARIEAIEYVPEDSVVRPDLLALL